MELKASHNHFSRLITSTANAYNAITSNSLQSLPQWMGYFNSPTGGSLSLLNVIQVSIPIQIHTHLNSSPADRWILGCTSHLTLFGGWFRTSHFRFHWCIDNVCRHCRSDCGHLPEHVHWCSVCCSNSYLLLSSWPAFSFLIGFGLTFAVIAAPMLVAEIAYPSHRGPLTAAYNSLWYSGAIAWIYFQTRIAVLIWSIAYSAAWSTFGAAKIQNSWSWRLPSIIQSAPSVLQVALIWFGPESPRWLISKNRNAEALKILAYYHADSNEFVMSFIKWFSMLIHVQGWPPCEVWVRRN